MHATQHPEKDRLGEATVLAPVGGLILLFLALFLDYLSGSFAKVAVMVAIGVLVLSVPFAAWTTIASIRNHRKRMWLSLAGFITASVFSVLVVGIAAGVKRKADAARRILAEQQAAEAGQAISPSPE